MYPSISKDHQEDSQGRRGTRVLPFWTSWHHPWQATSRAHLILRGISWAWLCGGVWSCCSGCLEGRRDVSLDGRRRRLYLVVDYFLAMSLLIAYRSSHFLIWLGGEDPHPPSTPPCAHEVKVSPLLTRRTGGGHGSEFPQTLSPTRPFTLT